MSDSKAERLRDLIRDPELLVMPGVFDPLSAKVAEAAGFHALQCSGLGISAVHLGYPDYSIASLGEMVTFTERIVRNVDVPVMGDADSGFGNAVSAHLAVEAFERAGAAGINLEDQVVPKRCGHLDGKVLADIDEATAKVRSAAEARRHPAFVINARTDALAVEGIDGVISRGNRYLEAGATMIFVEGITSREDIAAAVAGISGPVGINIVPGGKSPADLTFSELQAMGVARVSLPGVLLFAALDGMIQSLEAVTTNGRLTVPEPGNVTFRRVQDLSGMGRIEELERRYLGELLNHRSGGEA
jgi:2-methylisocitrate lyase-like PEP mutase family enzyme